MTLENRVRSKPISRRPTLAISSVICLVSLGLYIRVHFIPPPPVLLRLLGDAELKTLDTRFLLRGKCNPDPSILIVAIDQKSEDELGRWPFPRSDFAKSVDFLCDAGARVVVFDISFPHPTKNPALQVLEKIKSLRSKGQDSANKSLESYLNSMVRDGDDDSKFSEALSKYRNAILGYFFLPREEAAHQDSERVKEFVNYLTYSAYQNYPRDLPAEMDKGFAGLDSAALSPNLASFAVHARNFGFFNVFPDEDGAVRRVPLVARYKGHYYPSLGASAALVYANVRAGQGAVVFNRNGLEGIAIGSVIPVDPAGLMQINFHGPARTYPHYSFSDVVNRRLPPEAFRDKLVLIGPTAPGIADFVPTPFQPVGFPGVEVHANAIDNLLNRDFIRRGYVENLIDVFFIVLFSLGVGVALGVLSPRRATAVVAISLGLFILLTYYLLAYHNIWIAAFIPVATLSVNYAAVVSYRFVVDE